MNDIFVLETTVERTLPEFGNYRDDVIHFHLFSAVDSPNFHWFELRFQDETIRFEALRSDPEPDEEYHWQWPEHFRLLVTKGAEQTEQIIPRGKRGAGLLALRFADMPLQTFSHLAVMKREDFVSLSYQVGRLTKILRPQTAGGSTLVGN